MESESEQLKVYVGRAGVEQQFAAQAAMVSHIEHRVHEECTAPCQQRQMHDLEIYQKLERLRNTCDRNHMDFLNATKRAVALKRELARKDEHIAQLQQSLEQAKSVPFVSSWQFCGLALLLASTLDHYKKQKGSAPFFSGLL